MLAGCDAKPTTNVGESKPHPEWAEGATVYELNTRQLTPEGTFAAATAELDRIKALGVDIIWVMPIQPIGKLERKGSLGSYYAISDYTGFNPEFGTRADFQRFVDRAHELGMHVVLDWVANHTSPDHVWAVNEGWHKRDSMGKLKVQYDWTDISELEYENPDMRRAMQQAMLFWVDSIDVDGFRCDMAMLVPTDFWEETLPMLQKSKPELFMLSEAEEPDLTRKAFDTYYGWELHHTLNAIAQGKVKADSLARHLGKAAERFPAGAMRLNFTSNHDENSWSGSEFERMGDAAQTMAALTYALPGMPLIYSGQEFGNAKRIRFFDKDTIARVENAPQTEFYRSMNAMRKAHPALRTGAFTLIDNSAPGQVLSFERTSADGETVVAVFNLSATPQNVKIDYNNPNMNDVSTNAPADLKVPVILEPWGYRFFN